MARIEPGGAGRGLRSEEGRRQCVMSTLLLRPQEPGNRLPRLESRLQAGSMVFRRSRLLPVWSQDDIQGRPDCWTRVNAELRRVGLRTATRRRFASLRSESRLQAGSRVFRRSRFLFQYPQNSRSRSDCFDPRNAELPTGRTEISGTPAEGPITRSRPGSRVCRCGETIRILRRFTYFFWTLQRNSRVGFYGTDQRGHPTFRHGDTTTCGLG